MKEQTQELNSQGAQLVFVSISSTIYGFSPLQWNPDNSHKKYENFVRIKQNVQIIHTLKSMGKRTIVQILIIGMQFYITTFLHFTPCPRHSNHRKCDTFYKSQSIFFS